tara:strand:+ start:52 stop:447 length:396 start_codon:yes stop_codon:yes gene_type:complete
MDHYSDDTAANKAALGLLRIITAFLFIPHGAQKLFGALGQNPVELLSLSGVAGVLEFFGGLAILIGLFTRPIAFVLSGLMAAAYWIAHGFKDFWPILNGGEKAVLYCFIFLFLFIYGGGSFSVDGWLQRKK